tara:strand:+ start:64 stop:642 length:579 start_codon:yes stop_codon:yes gene_type:complete
MKIYKILYLSFLFILFSCDGFNEEIVPISVNVEDVESILVINGEIEEGKVAWVQISYSEDIDASISSPINYEINASVSIAKSDGSSEEMSHIFNGIYVGSSIKGKVGETHTMTINIGDQTYTATSTMLSPPGYQGAWVYQLGSNNNGKNSNDEGELVNILMNGSLMIHLQLAIVIFSNGGPMEFIILDKTGQ